MAQTITLTRSDDYWVITDETTGVTTQAETKPEALLMLADALVAYEGTDIDLCAAADEIFTLSDDQREFLASLADADTDGDGAVGVNVDGDGDSGPDTDAG